MTAASLRRLENGAGKATIAMKAMATVGRCLPAAFLALALGWPAAAGAGGAIGAYPAPLGSGTKMLAAPAPALKTAPGMAPEAAEYCSNHPGICKITPPDAADVIGQQSQDRLNQQSGR